MPAARQFRFQVCRSRMRFAESVFHAFARLDRRIYLNLMPEIEGDGAINLLQTQRRIVCANRLGNFAVPVLVHDSIQRHTTPREVEPVIAPLYVLLVHHPSFCRTESTSFFPRHRGVNLISEKRHMIIGVPKEIKDHETRVGLVPSGVTALLEAGHEVLVETHAGEGSSLTDQEYAEAG